MSFIFRFIKLNYWDQYQFYYFCLSYQNCRKNAKSSTFYKINSFHMPQFNFNTLIFLNIYKCRLNLQIQMQYSLLAFILTFSSVFAAQYRRLQTQATTKLIAEDQLISTLGIFRLTLVKSKCMLKIQVFDGNSLYTQKGNYTNPTITNDCEYLELAEGKLLTNTGQEYMKVTNPPYTSTSLTIDDNGVIRLMAIENSLTAQILPKENVFSIVNFQTDNPYIKAVADQQIDFSFGGSITNLRQWRFAVNTAQLQIYKAGNPGIIVAYVFSHLNVKPSGLYDFNDLKMPFALFPNITFPPRCFQPQKYLDHKGPYVFVADPYWPIFRLYQQGRYVVKEVAYGNLPQFYFPSPEKQLHFADYYSPCPDYTFQHKGDCVAKCPQPYFHDMVGQKGKCMLICEQDTIIDFQKRICNCMTSYESGKFTTELINQCPENSEIVPYGCRCTQKNRYFDRYVSLKCVQNCPPKTFAQNGLCMACPPNCKSCQLDGFYRSYLQCKQCDPGYQVLATGKCGLSCNTNLGLSIVNNTCVPCADLNCTDCSNNPAVCLKCNPTFALENSSCVLKCSNNFRQTHKSDGSTVCLPKDSSCLSQVAANYNEYAFLKCDSCSANQLSHGGKCLLPCPSGFKTRNNYCICQNETQLTIGDRCFNLPGCPIKMSLDLRSRSCLSCPEGCISCIQNSCTSCVPGYFLRVAPQFVTCFRKSPLTNCQQQYSLQQGACVVKTFANLDMNLCVSNVANCLVCVRLSKDLCVLCQPGFKIYNNTCIRNCPNGLIAYENTCILPEIGNCQVPHILTDRIPITVNRTTLLNSNPYAYYIQNQISPFNIPVGYIPYSQLLIQVEDKRTRDSFVRQTSWTCLKCIAGYGLASDFKSCQVCPSPCVTCYLARNDSCLTTSPVGPAICAYRDRQTNRCLSSCDQPNVPLIEATILYCVPQNKAPSQGIARIDSAIYQMQNDSKVVFFIFDDVISKNTLFQLNIFSLPSLEKIKAIQKQRLLQNVSETLTPAQIREGTYIQISQTKNDLFILNLTGEVQNLKTQQGFLFPNQIYGSETGLSHPQFMTTWIAWVGYIMAPVIIILHVWFIGNQLLYKVDNLIIFIQSIYYFSFVKLLVGKILAQFYYGWIYGHAGFFPNFFRQMIPYNYFERSAPNSYKLATVDSNVLRNAGFSFSLFIIYLSAFLVIVAFVYILFKYFKRTEVWYPNVAKQSLYAGIQFLSMNVVYWSVACLMYNYDFNIPASPQEKTINTNFNRSSTILSIVMLIIVGIYTFFRFFTQILGGIYMLKRIAVAIVLAGAAVQKVYLLGVLIPVEIIFVLLRIVVEKPDTTKEKVFLFLEQCLIMIAYILLFANLETAVNTIVISIIVFLFLISLAADLTEVYLQSQNEWPEGQNKNEDSKNGIAKLVYSSEQVS